MGGISGSARLDVVGLEYLIAGSVGADVVSFEVVIFCR